MNDIAWLLLLLMNGILLQASVLFNKPFMIVVQSLTLLLGK